MTLGHPSPAPKPSVCRTQVCPWLYKLVLAWTAKAPGCFPFVTCQKAALQPMCSPSAWLESIPVRCSVGLRFALTRTHRVWEVPLGNEVAAWHGSLIKGLPPCLKPAPAANGEQPGALSKEAPNLPITFKCTSVCCVFSILTSECGRLFSLLGHRILSSNFVFSDQFLL